jgi:hypothetical protein
MVSDNGAPATAENGMKLLMAGGEDAPRTLKFRLFEPPALQPMTFGFSTKTLRAPVVELTSEPGTVTVRLVPETEDGVSTVPDQFTTV